MRRRWPALILEEVGDYPAAWALSGSQPDFCLVDLSMPGSEPLDGVRALRALAPDAVLIVVTGIGDQRLLDAVSGCGVAAVCSKNTEPYVLMETLLAHVPGLLALECRRLPPRQLQVLRLMAQGMTNKQVAQRLGISPATVKTHMARLAEELGAINRTDAVARAKSLGVL